MNSWADIYSFWKAASVPEVEIKAFDVKLHHDSYPWFWKEDNTQFFHQGNPVKHTAFHLAAYLKGKDSELISAYKILAYARSIGARYALSRPLREAFLKFDETPGWWPYNPKHVLPSISYEIQSDLYWKENPTSEDIVIGAIAT